MLRLELNEIPFRQGLLIPLPLSQPFGGGRTDRVLLIGQRLLQDRADNSQSVQDKDAALQEQLGH